MRYGRTTCCMKDLDSFSPIISRACSSEDTNLTPLCLPPLTSHSASGLDLDSLRKCSRWSGSRNDFGRNGSLWDAGTSSYLLAKAAAPGNWFVCTQSLQVSPAPRNERQSTSPSIPRR